MPLYPGDQPPQVRQISSVSDGAALTVSELVLGCHVGTHVDAPAHFISGGKHVDDLDLCHFFGRAVVIDITGRDRITLQDVSGINIPPTSHILIKTRNSELLPDHKFHSDYCYLLPAATERLLQFRPLSIGFDYYSVDPQSVDMFPSHLAIARYGIPAFVCLNLRNIDPGEYGFMALPLKLPGVEGIPVRAVLLQKPGDRNV